LNHLQQQQQQRFVPFLKSVFEFESNRLNVPELQFFNKKYKIRNISHSLVRERLEEMNSISGTEAVFLQL